MERVFSFGQTGAGTEVNIKKTKKTAMEYSSMRMGTNTLETGQMASNTVTESLSAQLGASTKENGMKEDLSHLWKRFPSILQERRIQLIGITWRVSCWKAIKNWKSMRVL